MSQTQVADHLLDTFLDRRCPLSDGRSVWQNTWRDWLCEVLAALLRDGERFSGKHPGGQDSSWGAVLDEALAAHGLLTDDGSDRRPDVYQALARRALAAGRRPTAAGAPCERA